MLADKLITHPELVLPDDGLALAAQGAALMITHLIGSYDRVARHIDALQTQADMDGVIMTFPDFVPGVATFGAEIMPRMTTRQVAPVS
jgi:alkanesulfonate monooxygenase SsuD/methylene tetrahydromethanopterin reductase-like flavin-dependent oxidoreductase (luciferase family)